MALMAVGDLDGNGFPDCVCHYPTSMVAVMNHGSAGYAPAVPLPDISGQCKKVVLADFDIDGDLDIFLFRGDSGSPPYAAHQNSLLINDGRANFTNETALRWPTGWYSTMDGALVDLDGDGLLDVVEANIDRSRIYLGQPGGFFTDVTATHLPYQLGRWQVAAGDLDGIQGPDLVFSGTSSTGSIYAYLNDGSAHFTDISGRFAGRTRDWGVAIGDVDGDADQDIVCAVYGLLAPIGMRYSQLLRNDGTANFTVDPSAFPPSPAQFDIHQYATLTDIDDDGDLDALLGSQSSLRPIFLNDGSGRFGEARVGTELLMDPCIGIWRVYPADMDSDGDLDLVVGALNCAVRPVVLYSLARHLSAANPPRIGQTYAATLAGAPNGVGMLLLSLGSGFWPQPYGNLMLDPASLFLWPGIAILDATGRGTMNLPIPNAPNFVGDPIYFQSLVTGRPAGALGFTNAISESILP
jgi:hypothetical protein